MTSIDREPVNRFAAVERAITEYECSAIELQAVSSEHNCDRHCEAFVELEYQRDNLLDDLFIAETHDLDSIETKRMIERVNAVLKG